MRWSPFGFIGSLASVVTLCPSSSLALGEPAKKPALAHAPATAGNAKSGRIAVNGIEYYYELHRGGEPLLLLHNGLGSIHMFAPVLIPKLKMPVVLAYGVPDLTHYEMFSSPRFAATVLPFVNGRREELGRSGRGEVTRARRRTARARGLERR